MDDLVPFSPQSDRSKPRHCFAFEPEQYRVKVRRFSALPAEFTVQRVNFDRDIRAYERAAQQGYSTVTRPPRRPRDPDRTPDPEDLERAQWRAKQSVRLRVLELAPSALVTFTTREILTIDQLLWVWQHFARLMRSAGVDFEYVAVPERHPSNPAHLHLHVAYRGRCNFSTLRRFWHMSLEARHGRRVAVILRGAESPGNVDVQPVKSRDSLRRMRKISRYVAKYITKDLITEFNRRRYWPSKGISLQEAQVFWLDSINQADAIREACTMMGQWDNLSDAPAQKIFRPSDRVAWCAIDPDKTPPPPF
jgi:hypothetical protein